MSVSPEDLNEKTLDVPANTSVNAKLAVIEDIEDGIDEQGNTSELAVAKSLIPWPWDDNKAKYLGYRAISFTSKEAARLVGVRLSAVSNWRENPEFAAAEKYVFENRRAIADEFIEAEFKRNFGLVLVKDRQIIEKSLNGGLESKAENDYLLKMRQYYTPQQYQIIKSIVTGIPVNNDEESFDFTKSVLTLARTTERLELKTRG